MVFGRILSNAEGMEVWTADNQKFKIGLLEALGFKILGIPHIGVRRRAGIIFSLLKLDRKDKVLDAGCGIGLYSFELKKEVSDVTGMDIDGKKIGQAREIARRVGEDIKFVKADLTKLKIKNDFDKIICSDVIEHIPDYRKAVICLARALKSRGEMVLTFPRYTEFNKMTYKRFGHVVPGYREEDIEELLKKEKCRIEKVKLYSGVFTKIAFKINNMFLGNKILTGLLFYPLYALSFLDFLSRNKDLDGAALLIKKI